jgi:hypothetical protein
MKKPVAYLSKGDQLIPVLMKDSEKDKAEAVARVAKAHGLDPSSASEKPPAPPANPGHWGEVVMDEDAPTPPSPIPLSTDPSKHVEKEKPWAGEGAFTAHKNVRDFYSDKKPSPPPDPKREVGLPSNVDYSTFVPVKRQGI